MPASQYTELIHLGHFHTLVIMRMVLIFNVSHPNLTEATKYLLRIAYFNLYKYQCLV